MLIRFIRFDKYYNLRICKNLFGNTSIVCSYGSNFSGLGNIKIIECKTQEEIEKKIRKITKKRLRHGYEKVEILEKY